MCVCVCVYIYMCVCVCVFKDKTENNELNEMTPRRSRGGELVPFKDRLIILYNFDQRIISILVIHGKLSVRITSQT